MATYGRTRRQETSRLFDHRSQGEEVLHGGVRPEQRVGKAGGFQARLDLCLTATTVDGRIGVQGGLLLAQAQHTTDALEAALDTVIARIHDQATPR